MGSKYRLGLVAAGLSLVGLAACGDDSNQGTGGTGGTATTSTTGPTSTGTMSGSTTGSGGAGGMVTSDGNDSFDEAQDIPVNDMVMGAMGATSDLGFTGDADYYKFNGKKGQAIQIVVFAQELDMATFDPSYIDTVITLHDASKAQIAGDDDPIPQTQNDSILTTVLPADGLYYLKITECWSQQDTGCADPKDKTNTNYQMYVFNLDPAQPGTVADTEKGNTAADFETVTYAPNPDAMSSGYYATTLYGTFKDATDIDVFKFTPPADINITAGRPSAYIEASVTGVDANGSTVPQGKIWLTDATGAIKIGEIDGTTIDPQLGLTLQPPIDLTQSYLIWVQHPAGAMSGTNPFYVLTHYNGGSNDPEAELAAGGTNDTIATAEPMPSGMTQDGGTGYFIAGDLGATDLVDVFSFDVTGVAGDKMAVACSGQRIGSGLRGLKFTVTKADGSSVTTATETATDNANTGDAGVDFPLAEQTLYLKVEKSLPSDPLITGTYYQCGARFFTPTM